MSKYYNFVARAITETDSAASRQAIYERMRAALSAQLLRAEPRLTDTESKQERSSLEEAISRVERQTRANSNLARDNNNNSAGHLSGISKVKSGPKYLWHETLLAVIAIQAIFLTWLLLTPTPTTQELDSDLNQISEQINQASAENEKYESGLLKTLIELQTKTLKSTQSMLQQKRLSLLRRINLDFEINGQKLTPATDKELHDIDDSIQQEEQKLTEAKTSAARYTGGLVQAMALVNVETDQLALAQLRLKYYAAKYGLPSFTQPETPAKEPTSTPGKVVPDRDAL